MAFDWNERNFKTIREEEKQRGRFCFTISSKEALKIKCVSDMIKAYTVLDYTMLVAVRYERNDEEDEMFTAFVHSYDILEKEYWNHLIIFFRTEKALENFESKVLEETIRVS